MRLAKSILRILAMMAREIVELLRRPRTLLSVVAGPVLILGLFGLGWTGQPPMRTVLVIPPGSGLSTDPATYASTGDGRVTIVGVTPDPAVADRALADGSADVVVVAPSDARSQLAAGQQAVLTIRYSTVSPYRAFIAQTAASAIVAGVNRQVQSGMAREIEAKASSLGVDIGVSPDVVASPTRADVVNVAPSQPDLVAFYGLMVLALIVQHTIVTISGLSMLHDRRLGMLDLFRISPMHAGEILVGKYAAFTFLGSAVALVLLGLLVVAFHIPFLAAPGIVAGSLALLVLASIGMGVVIALLADNERQTIQLSLLLLLASVFFSGLALDLVQFSLPVRIFGGLLPVTEAGTILQNLLLQGSSAEPWRLGVLGAIAAALFVVAWILLHRQMVRPA